MSIHPTMTNEEIEFIMDGIEELAKNFKEWSEDYTLDLVKGRIEAKDKTTANDLIQEVDDCFEAAF
jgi:hypothetical protein